MFKSHWFYAFFHRHLLTFRGEDLKNIYVLGIIHFINVCSRFKLQTYNKHTVNYPIKKKPKCHFNLTATELFGHNFNVLKY